MILQNPNETMFEHGQSVLASLLEDRIRLMRVQHEKQRWWMGETGLKYQERKKHDLFSLEKILWRGDMIEVFIIATGYEK